jgi:hypothetical protein
MAVSICRDKAIQVIEKFSRAWDGTEQHYQEFKSVLRAIPDLEFENLKQLGVFK